MSPEHTKILIQLARERNEKLMWIQTNTMLIWMILGVFLMVLIFKL